MNRGMPEVAGGLGISVVLYVKKNLIPLTDSPRAAPGVRLAAMRACKKKHPLVVAVTGDMPFA
jgi:hypothetical protein